MQKFKSWRSKIPHGLQKHRHKKNAQATAEIIVSIKKSISYVYMKLFLKNLYLQLCVVIH